MRLHEKKTSWEKEQKEQNLRKKLAQLNTEWPLSAFHTTFLNSTLSILQQAIKLDSLFSAIFQIFYSLLVLFLTNISPRLPYWTTLFHPITFKKLQNIQKALHSNITFKKLQNKIRS